jgi:hypothetical protein
MQTLKSNNMIVIPPKDKQPCDLPTEDLRALFDGFVEWYKDLEENCIPSAPSTLIY